MSTKLRSLVVSIGADLSGMNKGLSDGARSISSFSAHIDKAGGGFAKAGQAIGNTAATIGKAYAAAVVAVGVSSVALLKNISDIGSEYNAKISGIGAVSGATAEELEKLNAAALEAGARTSFSASESAQAIEELIKSGLTVEQVLGGGLQGALDLAAAGELSVAEAAEIASTALNAFKDDNLTVTAAANILAGAANASATDVAGLKLGLSQASAVAAGMGMSFEDTSVALAVFAQNGLKGSDAGTSLKTMLMNLQPTSAKQAQLFEELGLTTDFANNKFYDAEGSMKPLADIAGTLQESMADLTDQERALALETIFGSDAVRAGNVLFKEGATGVTSMYRAMSKVTAADVAKKRLDNFKGSLEALNGSLETFKIKLYQYMDKPLQGITKSLTDTVNRLSSDGTIESLGNMLTGLFGIFTGNSGSVEMFGKMFSDNLNNVVTAAAESLADAVPRVLTALGELIPAIISGINTFLVTALTENKEETYKAATGLIDNLAAAITDGFPTIIREGTTLVIKLVEAIARNLPLLAETGLDALTEFLTAIADNTDDIVDTAVDVIDRFVGSLKDNQTLTKLVGAARRILISLSLALTSPDNLPVLINAATDLLIEIIDAISGGSDEYDAASRKIHQNLSESFAKIDWGDIGARIAESIIGAIIDTFIANISGEIAKTVTPDIFNVLPTPKNSGGGGRSFTPNIYTVPTRLPTAPTPGPSSTIFELPQYALGTSYVPMTGPAIIHKGEAVLTEEENSSLSDRIASALSSAGGGETVVNVYIDDILTATQKTSKRKNARTGRVTIPLGV